MLTLLPAGNGLLLLGQRLLKFQHFVLFSLLLSSRCFNFRTTFFRLVLYTVYIKYMFKVGHLFYELNCLCVCWMRAGLLNEAEAFCSWLSGWWLFTGNWISVTSIRMCRSSLHIHTCVFLLFTASLQKYASVGERESVSVCLHECFTWMWFKKQNSFILFTHNTLCDF